MSSLANNAFAIESEDNFAVDQFPLEGGLSTVPFLGDCESVHIADQSGLDFATVHGGDVLFDAGDEELVGGLDGRLGVDSDAIAFLNIFLEIDLTVFLSK